MSTTVVASDFGLEPGTHVNSNWTIIRNYVTLLHQNYNKPEEEEIRWELRRFRFLESKPRATFDEMANADAIVLSYDTVASYEVISEERVRNSNSNFKLTGGKVAAGVIAAPVALPIAAALSPIALPFYAVGAYKGIKGAMKHDEVLVNINLEDGRSLMLKMDKPSYNSLVQHLHPLAPS